MTAAELRALAAEWQDRAKLNRNVAETLTSCGLDRRLADGAAAAYTVAVIELRALADKTEARNADR